MAGLDQLGEVAEEQRQQQHLDVRAVDVGITQDADLAVAQAGEVRRVVGAVRVHAQGHRDVVDLVVLEQQVALDLPGIEHLAAQRQDGLGLLVAAHLGAAARRVALHQEDLVVQQVAALAVGQLAGQNGHAGALALLDLLAGALAGLGLLDDQLGQLLAVLDMLVQPQLERRLHIGRHQAQRVARVQPLLGLALELRVQHLGTEHEAGAREHIVRHQLHALGQQRMHLDEALDRAEQAVLEAGLVGAAGHRRDQVHIALAQRRAVLGEGHAPAGALAFGEVLALAGGREAFALEQRDQRLGRHRLGQVVAQAGLVLPGRELAGLLDLQRHRHAGHQHGLGAQQMHQLVPRQLGALEILGLGPDPHRRTLLAVAADRRAGRHRLHHVAMLEGDAGDLLVAPDGHLQPLGECIRHRHAHAVQAAGEAVGAARALVELAAGMQPREHDLHHWHALFRVQAEGNAAAVVGHRDRAVDMQGQVDALAETGQGLIGGVVDHLLDDVQRVVGTGVHARPLLDGLQALQDADRGFAIGGGRGRRTAGHRAGILRSRLD
mmetsp:Transcript_81331/g.225986  ORF Transcript_81331/g.225986 Transcript_81331/m.225986 type:complete len:550 (-) Transcript_81331:503-2152(-)